ncbi:hypothetical protein GGF32_002524 [Allomyces javanicus]|nr:hypothetical protein GGF32_002524 [Allomyces javanicus]
MAASTTLPPPPVVFVTAVTATTITLAILFLVGVVAFTYLLARAGKAITDNDPLPLGGEYALDDLYDCLLHRDAASIASSYPVGIVPVKHTPTSMLVDGDTDASGDNVVVATWQCQPYRRDVDKRQLARVRKVVVPPCGSRRVPTVVEYAPIMGVPLSVQDAMDRAVTAYNDAVKRRFPRFLGLYLLLGVVLIGIGIPFMFAPHIRRIDGPRNIHAYKPATNAAFTEWFENWAHIPWEVSHKTWHQIGGSLIVLGLALILTANFRELIAVTYARATFAVAMRDASAVAATSGMQWSVIQVPTLAWTQDAGSTFCPPSPIACFALFGRCQMLCRERWAPMLDPAAVWHVTVRIPRTTLSGVPGPMMPPASAYVHALSTAQVGVWPRAATDSAVAVDMEMKPRAPTPGWT